MSRRIVRTLLERIADLETELKSVRRDRDDLASRIFHAQDALETGDTCRTQQTVS